MSALIQVVDENDKPVGSATKQEAWDKGLIHRVVRIMIENSKGQILLQRRDPDKQPFPNCWDNSVGGHVDAGEEYDEAVVRELEEELALRDLPLTELGRYYEASTWQSYQLKRFCKVYKARFETLPTTLEAGEVSEVRWFTVAEIKKLIAEAPEQVTDGLRQVIKRYY